MNRSGLKLLIFLVFLLCKMNSKKGKCYSDLESRNSFSINRILDHT